MTDASDPLAWGSAGSGVSKLEMRVDGQVINTATDVVSRTCEGDGIDGNGVPASEVPWGSCSIAKTFNIDPSLLPGEHIVDIVATDSVGNVASQSARVTVGPEPPAYVAPSLAVQTITINGPNDVASLGLDLAPGQELAANSDGSVDVVNPAGADRGLPLDDFDHQVISSTNSDPSIPAEPAFQQRPATQAEADEMRSAAVNALSTSLTAQERSDAIAEVDSTIQALRMGQPAVTEESVAVEQEVVETIPSVGVSQNDVPVGVELTANTNTDVVTIEPEVAVASNGDASQPRAGGKKVTFPVRVKISAFPRNYVVRPAAPVPSAARFFRQVSLPPSPTSERAYLCHRDNNQHTVESLLGSDLVKVGETIHWCQTGSPWPVESVQVKDVDRKAQVLPRGSSVGWTFLNWLNKHEGWQSGESSNPHYAYFVRNRALFRSGVCSVGVCQQSTPSVYIRVAANGKVRREDGGG